MPSIGYWDSTGWDPVLLPPGGGLKPLIGFSDRTRAQVERAYSLEASVCA
jgi:hypothetical protein